MRLNRGEQQYGKEARLEFAVIATHSFRSAHDLEPESMSYRPELAFAAMTFPRQIHRSIFDCVLAFPASRYLLICSNSPVRDTKWAWRPRLINTELMEVPLAIGSSAVY